MKYFFAAIGGGIITLIICLAFVFAKPQSSQSTPSSLSPLRYSQTELKFTNPLLGIDPQEESKFKQLRSLENSLTELIDKSIAERKITTASVYVRDLTSFQWVDVNEKETFIPASLLKLPLMIQYFKLAEKDPNILKEKITYQKLDPNPLSQNIKPQHQLTIDQDYTIEELVYHMIKASDNEAMYLLSKKIGEEKYQSALDEINSILAPEKLDYNSISTKTYSLFLRVLYDSTYLTPQNSEKALALLTESEYNGGLVAGVPSNIKIAHKFGERHYQANGQDVEQLHDCGIVYLPQRPYAICAMSKGDNFQNLQDIIKQISKTTYEALKN